jgi:putative oxidoreductase
VFQASRQLTRPFIRARDLLDSIPYSIVALIARLATFSVFFRSGTQKLSDWQSTLMLFANEYRVPIISPHFAAYLAAGLELSCSVLILGGLLTRAATLLLLGLTLVIQVFVYPSAWPDHIQWVAFMSILIARGPGLLSFDYLLSRIWARRRSLAGRSNRGGYYLSDRVETDTTNSR